MGFSSFVSGTIGPVPLNLTWEDEEHVHGGCVERASGRTLAVRSPRCSGGLRQPGH